MTFTNVKVGNQAYTLSHAGVCGASTFVSMLLSAPAGFAPEGGRGVVLVTTNQNAVPLNVQARIVAEDVNGVAAEFPIPHDLVSNTTTFGPSAVQRREMLVGLSGENQHFQVIGICGSAIRVYLFAASNSTSALTVCGNVQVWRV